MEPFHTDAYWLDCLGHLREAGRPACLVVVSGVAGSTPREVGARMIVSGGELAWGTIGGGRLERVAIEEATALLADPEAPSQTRTFPLSERVGQCCGGQVTLFFEPLRWRRRTLAIFGAGHVGQALGGLAPWLGLEVALFDERSEDALVPTPPHPPGRPYRLVQTEDHEEEMDRLAPDSLVVVMTHDHALDERLIEHALRHHDFPYLGLIGSTRKWERFRSRLSRREIGDELLDRVTCPIGLGRVSKEPAAIALSAAAQIREILDALPSPAAPG